MPDAVDRGTVVLADANAIIEAVRIRCWKALTGGLRVETVEECRDETRRGSPHRPGYVTVAGAELDRLAAVHAVTALERAALALSYERAMDLDAGERDLMAHALSRAARGDRVWVVCSPDRAAVRAAVALGHADRLVSLDDLLRAAGARPSIPMAGHFGRGWLVDFRTACLLGR